MTSAVGRAVEVSRDIFPPHICARDVPRAIFVAEAADHERSSHCSQVYSPRPINNRAIDHVDVRTDVWPAASRV